MPFQFQNISKLPRLLMFLGLRGMQSKPTLWFIITRIHQLINSSTYKPTNSSTHKPNNSQTYQLINSKTHQLKNSSTQKLINSKAHQLNSSPTQQLTNSQTCQFTSSPTHKPINSSTQRLNFIVFILQYGSNFHSVLARKLVIKQ